MTALPTGRTQVFISYSHEDAPYLKQLQAQLKPYVRGGSLVFWDDTKIQAGKIWREELDAAVRSAKVAILLVSAAYLASDFIAEQELPALLAAAREEGMTLLPVIVSPCAFAVTPLAAYQTVNAPDQPVSGMRKAERDALWVRTACSPRRRSRLSRPLPPLIRPQAIPHRILCPRGRRNLAPAASTRRSFWGTSRASPWGITSR